jgi:uncharacterized membrane protein
MSSRWDTSRTEAFSDGVFAIAVTLLVLDLAIPQEEVQKHLAHGILHEWPGYLGHVTSFVVIGGLWLIHHGIFGRLSFVNSRVMRINLLLLLLVSFLPFPTRLMAQAIRNANAERTAVLFYGLTLIAVSLTITALWTAALRDRRLLRPGISEQEVGAVTRATAPNLGLQLAATAVAIPLPRVAAFMYLVIAVIAVLRARADEEIDEDAPVLGASAGPARDTS